MKKTICKLSDLPDPGARGFSVDIAGKNRAIILFRKGPDVFAYDNSCPHTGVTLDWMPDEFMDVTGKLLQCATHGALFRPEDGFCIQGPCAGGMLSAIKIAIEDGNVCLPDP